jgi:hypothetical protein
VAGVKRFQSGQTVALVGVVRFERNGFVTVRWPDGTETVLWAADLVLMETDA